MLLIRLPSFRRQLGAITRGARVAVAALSLTAAAFVGLTNREGWCNPACIPTAGDVPTVGFGSTTRDDGSPVKMGDTTTPVKALNRSFAYIQNAEAEMKATLEGVELHQYEYDVYVDWRYQFGGGAWRKSSMLRELKAGNYEAACNALLLYRYQAGRDCSKPENWGPRGCRGVWLEQQKRHQRCLGAEVG
ncbi:glycoside hydrolase family protein [Ramlibacter sp.]|uniref:glycoside hydrolase family protein n=1 Tax=Ramlibacter sp. TaxID=1917967 RepID=UPI003D0C21DC